MAPNNMTNIITVRTSFDLRNCCISVSTSTNENDIGVAEKDSEEKDLHERLLVKLKGYYLAALPLLNTLSVGEEGEGWVEGELRESCKEL